MSEATGIAVEAAGAGRFRARIDESWNALQGLNGGIVASAAVEATEVVLAAEGVDPAGTTLRAATFGYVNGTLAGEIDIEIDVVRRGRALVTSHARISQGGRTTVVGRLHHSSPWEGVAYSDAPAMPVRPVATVALRSDGAAHFARLDTQLHPDTVLFGGAVRAEWMAWSRPWQGGTLDTAWVTMFGDYLPPAVFARSDGPSRAVTVEYGVQIHLGARQWQLGEGEYLTARVHTFHSHDGFAVEDGHVWLPDGRLLATTRQTRLAG